MGVGSNTKEPNGADKVASGSCLTQISSSKFPSASRTPDGGWGWVVVGASFLTNWTIGIIYTGFSILYVEFSDYFVAEKGATGWIGSIYVATGNFLGFIFSMLINRHGCRLVTIVGALVSVLGFLLSAVAPNLEFLYASYGIVAGTGFGMVYMASTVIVQQYFTSNRALAAGLASSGLSVGVVTAGPIIQCLLDLYSWRGTLIVVAGLWLHVIVFGSLFRPLPQLINQSFSYKEQNVKQNPQQYLLPEQDIKTPLPSGEAMVTVSYKETQETSRSSKCSINTQHLSLLRNPALVLFGIGNLLLELGLLTFYHHTPSRAIVHGIERHRVALLPTITGISESLSRLAFGVIANRKTVNRTRMFGCGVTAAGMILTCYVFVHSFIEFAIYCAVMGVIFASFLTVQTTVVVDILGVEQAANGAAAMAFFKTTGFLVSIPFAGFLYDVSGNYDIPFYVAGSLQAVGGIIVLLTPIVKRMTKGHSTIYGGTAVLDDF